MIIDAGRLPSGGGEDSAVGNAVKGSRACHECRDRGLQDSIEAVTVSVAWQGISSPVRRRCLSAPWAEPTRAGAFACRSGWRPLPICADPGGSSFAALGCRTLPGALASLRVRSFRSVCWYLSYWMVPAPSPGADGLLLHACVHRQRHPDNGAEGQRRDGELVRLSVRRSVGRPYRR